MSAGPAGFTLVETLLVLAVIALLGSLLLPGVSSLLRAISEEEPDRMVRDTIEVAREQALTTNRTVWLRFDREKRLLLWGNETGERQKALPAGSTLQLLQPKAGSTILLGGVLVETEEVPAVRFYPDGTCDRFRLQLRQGTAAPLVIAIDPWTCAPMLEAAKP